MFSTNSYGGTGSAYRQIWKNQLLVQRKGYIRIQAKRHTLTYTDTNPVELSRAEIPYQPSKAQLGFHGGEEIYIPAHMKKSPFSLPTTISTFYSRKNLKHNSIGFGQRNKKQSQIKKKKSKFKLQLLKKKYYGWGKSCPKPPSSNQFLLFSAIWTEAATHTLYWSARLCGIVPCSTIFCADGLSVWF